MALLCFFAQSEIEIGEVLCTKKFAVYTYFASGSATFAYTSGQEYGKFCDHLSTLQFLSPKKELYHRSILAVNSAGVAQPYTPAQLATLFERRRLYWRRGFFRNVDV